MRGIGSAEICGPQVTTGITITGQCGINNEVEFLLDSGILGTITTSIACV